MYLKVGFAHMSEGEDIAKSAPGSAAVPSTQEQDTDPKV